MPEFETEITLRVRVEYAVLPGERGSRDRYGASETPDIPDEIEILTVTPLDKWLVARNGDVEIKDWQLPDAVKEQLHGDAENDIEAQAADYEP